MVELASQHLDSIIGAAVLLGLGWLAVRILGRNRVAHGSRIPLRVYCNHCNWEGTVTRASMACSRCRSSNLSVLAV